MQAYRASMELGGLKCSQPLSGGFKGQSPLRKFLGSKNHLNWLKINLNADEINEDYKRTKN